MAAQRCSTCGINYPVSVARCRLCGDPLDHMNSAAVDRDWQEQVEQRAAAGRDGEENGRITAWRLEQLLHAGYDREDADAIAGRAVGPDAVDLHQAVELVEHGCAPALAARILL